MTKEPINLSGRIVAITGGARGIGAATAQALSRAGAKVAIGDLDAALAQQTATSLPAGGAGFELDVTDRASFEQFVTDAEAALGPLDVLVNNAGIMPIGGFLDEDDATTRRIVEINCHGVMNGMKVVLPRFIARRGGHLVNIASIVGKTAVPGVATYSGSKHFVVGVTEAARLELRDTGVEVSCVMPGPVNTELTAGIPQARGVKNIEPEDVADAIVAAVASPRFDVYVPRSLGPLTKVSALMSRRAREGLGRLMQADTAVQRTDWSTRRAYEDRAARSIATGEAPEPEPEPERERVS
jgi:NADP-dependent 3-hydroxy acid dehydrogenase YdfG